MSTPFTTQCGVGVRNNYDTAGTFAKGNINLLGATDWEALFHTGTAWNEMSAYLKTQFEMAACGIQRNATFDWIMSSNRRGMGSLVGATKLDRGPSIIEPFVMGRQMSVINNDVYAISAGYAKASYTPLGTGPLTQAQLDLADDTQVPRVIRLVPGYSGNTLPMDEKMFLAKHFLYILGRASVGGAAQHGQWQIVAAALDIHGESTNYVDVLIESKNTWDTQYVDLAPTRGLVLCGLNSVHDVESYCKNRLNINRVKHVPFFWQVFRNGRRVSSLYIETFKKLMADNAFFQAFQDIPLAERNRQDEESAQREFVNSFWWGRRLNSNQTIELWKNLPSILSLTGASVDPGTGDALIYKRATMEGVVEQLNACGQRHDNTNSTINVKTFCEETIYDVHRSRQNGGKPSAKKIDVRTDSTSAFGFMQQYIEYVKDVSADTARIIIDQGETLGLNWRSFELFKPQGVTLTVIVEPSFDDLVNGLTNLPTGSLASRGNILAVVDVGSGGTVYPAIIDSKRKTFTTGQIEDLAKIDTTFACAMENPTLETSMTSMAVTTVVECPKNNVWEENFSSITYSA